MPDAMDAMKALNMIGRTAQRQREGKPSPMAMCTRCPDEPLVSTFEMRGYEFHCVACGGWFGFLDPRPAEPTPELDAKLEQRQAKYDAARAARDG